MGEAGKTQAPGLFLQATQQDAGAGAEAGYSCADQQEEHLESYGTSWGLQLATDPVGAGQRSVTL